MATGIFMSNDKVLRVFQLDDVFRTLSSGSRLHPPHNHGSPASLSIQPVNGLLGSLSLSPHLPRMHHATQAYTSSSSLSLSSDPWRHPVFIPEATLYMLSPTFSTIPSTRVDPYLKMPLDLLHVFVRVNFPHLSSIHCGKPGTIVLYHCL